MKIKNKILTINECLNGVVLSDISLLGGDLGILLFYLSREDNDGFQNKFQQLYQINNNAEKVFTFCNGFSGYGWFLQQLVAEKLLNKSEVEELLLQIDELTHNATQKYFKINNHDFLHGSVGSAFYLMDRFKEDANAKKYLLEILNNLNYIKKVTKKGIYWESEKNKYNKDTPLINFSLSHGLASKIVLFSKLIKNNIETELSTELLTESIQFLFSNKNESCSISSYPSGVNKIGNNTYSSNTNYSRLSWCYGDLGLSIALWQAGEALNDDVIKQEAINICLHTTKRKTPEETGIVDAGICHGTAGVAHIYNRMFRYTQKQEFKIACDYWIKETLNMATFKDGFAGYKSYKGEEKGWNNSCNLLDGVAGIGLVLHSYLHPEDEPTWDRCLLLS